MADKAAMDANLLRVEARVAELEADNRAMQQEADELEARLSEAEGAITGYLGRADFAESQLKEAEQSLLATKNALSGTQQVRDYYKQLAEEWLNEAAKLAERAEQAERERGDIEGFMGDVLAGCDIQRGARLFRQVEVVIGPGKTRAEIRVAALERRVAALLAQGTW